MALSFINKAKYAISEFYTDEYKKSIYDFETKTKLVRIGYVPGVIRHYYHGSKKNRNYTNRWKMLVNYEYNPYLHITKDENDVIIPTAECPLGLLDEIMEYFKSRNDDEMYEGGDYSKRIKSFASTSSFNEFHEPNIVSTLFSSLDKFINPENEDNK
jgi:hypothetical protein